jgi:GNAT superfamily N-acetyltransferase
MVDSTPDTLQSSSANGCCVEFNSATLKQLADFALINACSGFVHDESKCYVWMVGGAPAAVCVYWWNPLYATRRNFWPLIDKEAKLIHIETAETMRGKGIAAALIAASSYEMIAKNGFRRLFARVWHSNTPSMRAFVRSGWRQIAFVLECDTRLRKKPIRFAWRR